MLSDHPIISKVLLRYKFEPKREPYVPKPDRLPLELPVQPVDKTESPKNIFDLVRYLYTIIKGLVMKDWKTTISGIVAAVAYGVHAIWGVYIPEIVTNSVISLALFAIGYFSADKPSNK